MEEVPWKAGGKLGGELAALMRLVIVIARRVRSFMAVITVFSLEVMVVE